MQEAWEKGSVIIYDEMMKYSISGLGFRAYNILLYHIVMAYQNLLLSNMVLP